MMHSYSDEFFEYIEQGSFTSAERILPIVHDALKVSSVLDVGCGRGAWLKVWTRMQVDDVCGIDGAYVDRTALHVPHTKFIPHDLSQPFSIHRTFDLVTSLEVAEHLPRKASVSFIKSLTRHSDYVLFSAAVPGQGGEHHINERPLHYWRSLFEKQGYVPVDFLRPLIQDDAHIEPWYRNNTILYVRATMLNQAPKQLQSSIVHPDEKIANYGGLSWFLRRLIVRGLPRSIVTYIAQLNAARKARAFARAK